MPKTAAPWSLTSLREKLIKIGAKVVSHGGARRREMSDRISWNICRGTATSAIWKVTYRPQHRAPP
jgi:hypothetical protein